MADYTQLTFFAPKDALASGNPSKLIKGSEVDPELSAIAAAIASKYDSSDIASNAEALGLVLDTKLLTPAKLLAAMAGGTFTSAPGLISNLVIQGTLDQTADYLLAWDASANQLVRANSAAIASAVGTVPTGRALTAGNGLTGGGDLSADRTFDVGAGTGIAVGANAVSLSFLGLEALVDPNADRILFWDDSAGSFQWLTAGTGLTITGTSLTADVAQTRSSFTATIVGLASPTTATIEYVKTGNQVTMIMPNSSGTSNATSFRLTGTPAAIIPTISQVNFGQQAVNNGVEENNIFVKVNAISGDIEYFRGNSATGWTATGTKSFGGASQRAVISYLLA